MSFNPLKSPIKNIPSCWEDEKRMTVLYAPFRTREANPVDYDSKMKFWENVILNWCLEKNTCIFNLKIIQEEFKRKERIPLCLGTVLENLERMGQVRLKEDVLKMNPEESWTHWAVNCFVKGPIIWSLAKLKMALLESDINEIEYVNINYLKAKSEELVLRKQETQKNIYNLEDFQRFLRTTEGVEINTETLDILLLWLQLNKIIHVHQLENDSLFKFIVERKNTCIRDIDVSIYILEKNKHTIDNAIKALEKEKEDQMLLAKQFLKKGMRDTAKSYLRRKKAIEKSIEKRMRTSENVEILLSRINDVASDSQVLETYKIGLSALKATFKENGLSEDDVINTVTEIQQINEMHEEIQNALAEPVSMSLDSELDEELKHILQNVKNTGKDDLPLLPDVPPQEPEIRSKVSQKYALPS